MSTTLACIGLHVDGLDELNGYLEQMPTAVVGRTAGIESVQYADPSGARVVVVRDEEGDTLDLVPSYDAKPGALLGDLGPVGALAQADVLDDDNELATRLSLDLEQQPHLAALVKGPIRASVVALGVELVAYPDQAAFDAVDHGLPYGSESFVSYGLFGGEDVDPDPTAWLAGTVLAAETHTHSVTGQDFHVARLRTVGFEVTVCLAAGEDVAPPTVGGIVAGSCYLVGDVPTLWVVEPPRRRKRKGRFSRR